MTLGRTLPSWVWWLAIGVLASVCAGWGYVQGLDANREERDRIVAEFAEFRTTVALQGAEAQRKAAAEIKRQGDFNEQIHTAYGEAIDKLRARHAADRLRIAAGAARTGGGGVPAAPAAACGTDGIPEEPEPAVPRHAAAEAESSLIERCAEDALRLAWLQHWADEQANRLP